MTQASTAQGFDALAARPHADVLILGGGINGIATFRELALQGVDVALVERGDYVAARRPPRRTWSTAACATSRTASSGSCNEAVHERNAPAEERAALRAPAARRPSRSSRPSPGMLAAPLRFLTHGSARTVERGALLIKIGLIIYDSFSRDGGSVPRHRFLGRKKSLAELPHLNPTSSTPRPTTTPRCTTPSASRSTCCSTGRHRGDGRAANYVEAAGDGRVASCCATWSAATSSR